MLFRLTTLSFLATCSVSSAAAQEMKQFEIISACTQTIQRSAILRDQFDAEGYSDLFVEDGIIVINGNATEGRDAIAERVRKADRSIRDVHFTGSIVVDVGAGGAITAKSYVVIYEGETPTSPGDRSSVSEYLVSEYDDQMVMTNSGCKFIRRQVTILFDG